jgi:hypothetical protein
MPQPAKWTMVAYRSSVANGRFDNRMMCMSLINGPLH